MSYPILLHPVYSWRLMHIGRSKVPVKTITAEGGKENKCKKCIIRWSMQDQLIGLPRHQYRAQSNEQVAENEKTENAPDQETYLCKSTISGKDYLITTISSVVSVSLVLPARSVTAIRKYIVSLALVSSLRKSTSPSSILISPWSLLVNFGSV